MIEKKIYKYMDLFCGCGGFSKGFENVGFEGTLAVDIWKDAIELINIISKNTKQ